MIKSYEKYYQRGKENRLVTTSGNYHIKAILAKWHFLNTLEQCDSKWSWEYKQRWACKVTCGASLSPEMTRAPEAKADSQRQAQPHSSSKRTPNGPDMTELLLKTGSLHFWEKLFALREGQRGCVCHWLLTRRFWPDVYEVLRYKHATYKAKRTYLSIWMFLIRLYVHLFTHRTK